MSDTQGTSGHGVGDRADYYSKWDKFAEEANEETVAEENAAKEASDAALGINRHPRSEAEKKDREKHEQLKKMKEMWKRRGELEEQQKMVLENVNGEQRSLTPADLGGKRVLTIKNCENSELVLEPSLGKLIKIFVEDCKDLTVDLRTTFITSHLECAHCEGFKLRIQAPLNTLQLDLCSDVEVTMAPGIAQPCFGRPGFADYAPAQPRVVHAGVTNLSISAQRSGGGDIPNAPSGASYVDLVERTATESDVTAGTPAEEVQFITQLIPNGSEFETERLVRVGERMLTTRELRDEQEIAPVVNSNIVEAGTTEGAMATAQRRKEEGNEAFKQREYMQAMALYTMAIDAAPPAACEASEENQGKPLAAVCRCNRAACFLKLGQHEKALEDADECIAMAPAFAKGHFRKGMALHAMQRHSEAMPHLLKARDLAPKDNSIKEAIKFCEFRAREQMKGN